MEGWKDGRMEGWKDGRLEELEGWNVGRMEGWSVSNGYDSVFPIFHPYDERRTTQKSPYSAFPFCRSGRGAILDGCLRHIP